MVEEKGRLWQGKKKGLFGWNKEFGQEQKLFLEEAVRQTAIDILLMTTIAGSGHPGGSLSSRRILAMLYAYANIEPENYREPKRDRIIVSIGHVAPGVYATLSQAGFFPREDPIKGLRRAESIFSGHIESGVPGVEWNTGCLGQGLGAAVGKAWYAKKSGLDYVTFVLLGDGEQQKEQVQGGRNLAINLHKKGELGKLIALVDYNKMQLSGTVGENTGENIEDVLRQWEGSGWEGRVVENDFGDLFWNMQEILNEYKGPRVFLVKTKMGEGVSFMEAPEGDAKKAWKYHGKPLSVEDCKLGLESFCGGGEELNGYFRELDSYLEERKQPYPRESYEVKLSNQRGRLNLGEQKIYQVGEKVACREAFGKEIKELQKKEENKGKIINIDPDLGPSTNMPADIRTGIMEIVAAGLGGALSQEDLAVFFSTFGVFGVGEVYNTLRMIGLNQGTKFCGVGTHCGLDVGEDGPTHQCIDYLGLARNLFGFKVLYPADGNQAGEIARHVGGGEGNYLVFMGRNKMPVIRNEKGEPFFGKNFKLGKAYWLREGEEGTIITYGNMVGKSLEAGERLKEKGWDYGVLCFSTLAPQELLDKEAMGKAAERGRIVVYEDHWIGTGLGNMLADELLCGDYPQVRLKKLGIRELGKSGGAEELYRIQSLDVERVVKEIFQWV